MRIEININTGNAAFEDNPFELNDCLRYAVDEISRGVSGGRIRDTNGNTVGTFEVDNKE